jgi:hypothetical protein
MAEQCRKKDNLRQDELSVLTSHVNNWLIQPRISTHWTVGFSNGSSRRWTCQEQYLLPHLMRPWDHVRRNSGGQLEAWEE